MGDPISHVHFCGECSHYFDCKDTCPTHRSDAGVPIGAARDCDACALPEPEVYVPLPHDREIARLRAEVATLLARADAAELATIRIAAAIGVVECGPLDTGFVVMEAKRLLARAEGLATAHEKAMTEREEFRLKAMQFMRERDAARNRAGIECPSCGLRCARCTNHPG